MTKPSLEKLKLEQIINKRYTQKKKKNPATWFKCQKQSCGITELENETGLKYTED